MGAMHTVPDGIHSFMSVHVGAGPQLPVSSHVILSEPLSAYPPLHVYETILAKVVAAKLRLPFVTVGGAPQSTGKHVVGVPHAPVI